MKGFGPALALGGAALAGGCGPTAGTGDLTALSLGERPVLLGEPCVTAVYGRPGAETSFYLSTVPVPDLLEGRISEGVVIHIDLLWQPKAGVTPVDASATNVTIHYIVFAGGQVGVYGGSGFALPRGRLGSGRVGLSLMDASLTLLESTDGFVDLLSPARLTGALTASYDDEQARRVSRAVSQIVTNALGRSMFVQTNRVCFSAAEKQTRFASRPARARWTRRKRLRVSFSPSRAGSRRRAPRRENDTRRLFRVARRTPRRVLAAGLTFDVVRRSPGDARDQSRTRGPPGRTVHGALRRPCLRAGAAARAAAGVPSWHTSPCATAAPAWLSP